ncbi:MAG: hypothetical protein L6R37_007863 [Teloschistes peruensis]|nr:MAG: hypothetical protein L6R37_007863 [Teloschistes peruensis]
MTETYVARITLGDKNFGKVFPGVRLTDGRRLSIKESGEVLLCGSAYRSPQVLMLSGIGGKNILAKHEITQKLHVPKVGHNLHDYKMIFRYWKLRHSENGLAMGSPKFADPAFEKGNPVDWIATMAVPEDGLQAAIATDARNNSDDKTHASHQGGTLAPRDGCIVCGLRSRADGPRDTRRWHLHYVTLGSITISFKDSTAAPVIDSNYYATETDRHFMRQGWRAISRLMLETPEGKTLVAEEILPEGHKCLHSDASDQDIDARIKTGGMSCYQPAGSCSMRAVVDSSCKVYGVQGLRVPPPLTPTRSPDPADHTSPYHVFNLPSIQTNISTPKRSKNHTTDHLFTIHTLHLKANPSSANSLNPSTLLLIPPFQPPIFPHKNHQHALTPTLSLPTPPNLPTLRPPPEKYPHFPISSPISPISSSVHSPSLESQ